MTLPERQIYNMGPLLRVQWRLGVEGRDAFQRRALWLERGLMERIRTALIPMRPPDPPPPGLHPSPCWVWSGPVDAEGKGLVYNQDKRWPLHRLLYVISRGPLPDRIHLLPVCQNQRCCNPMHQLQVERGPITRPQGMDAMYPRCKYGHLMSPENTYEFQGKVMCRDCRAVAQARYRKRQSGQSARGVEPSSESPWPEATGPPTSTEWRSEEGGWTG
jgi:hypothetical protein